MSRRPAPDPLTPRRAPPLMLGITKLRNPIRHYPWGSRTAIAELLGRPSPAAEPEAELWLGAHPQDPSEAWVDGRWVALDRLVAERPEVILGPDAERHGRELPFLLKVLAAAEPLSIQAHPDREQAAAGYRREEELGIPRDAPERNYRDPRPKPEILYALTPFEALSGFRSPDDIDRRLRRLGAADVLPESRGLGTARAGEEGPALERFLGACMSLPEERIGEILPPLLDRAGELADEDPVCRWVAKLAARYPGDRGVLAPLFLHLHRLAPGQAIYTGPGILHAYLVGVGVELMQSSDNVLRGGLTAKHVDVPELLRTLRFAPTPPRLLAPRDTAAGSRLFSTPEGLTLEVITARPDRAWRGAGGRAAILLVGDGDGVLRGGEGSAAFTKGDSFLLPAALAGYRIEGTATLFRAELAPRESPP